jgi:hypothetical protein
MTEVQTVEVRFRAETLSTITSETGPKARITRLGLIRGSGLYNAPGRALLTPLLALPRFTYPTSSVALSFAPLKRCAGASVVRP